MTTRIALELGSGGARGYAHIGVIEALEGRGYEIDNVAGTSMGALVGGHADEMAAHESFNYALFDTDEPELIGCVYIDPTDKACADADISWWVRDEFSGSPVESALEELAPAWIADAWPLATPRYVGRDLSWAEWLAIPREP